MARRKKSRRSRKGRKASRPIASKANIQKVLVLAGIGFGLYMVMKGVNAPKTLPMVATVDGRPAPLSIVTDADIQNILNA